MKEEITKLQSRIKSLEQTEDKFEALKVNFDSANLKVIDFQKKMVHIKNQLSSMARARFESTNQKDKRILELLGELESSLYTQLYPTSQYKESNATVANEIDELRTSLSNKLLYENKGLYHKLKEFKKTISCKEANFKNTIMVLENENRELKYNIYRLTNTSVDNKPGFCSKSKIKGGSKDLLEDSNAYKYSINSDVLLTDDSPEQLNKCTLNKRRKIITKKV
ncbi:uncharacterized protein PRCAT00002928001 [Priceomyces carsonii]|uniref:uncharacterized protein n=1 Tax=Priceomyces carsonii TaxID=28549 RepID=UPI002EDA947C|nr:unnamed protein product [Priceomyces carsonii]